MATNLNRRNFLHQSALVSSAALAFRFEEQNLLAQAAAKPPAPAPPQAPQSFPQGKLGKLSVSRLICGGNLISGFAHSRDLIYVSPLLKHYFTDAKVFETLALCEAHGINTAILDLHAGAGQAVDRLQGPRRRRHSPARRLPLRVRERRGLPLRGHV